ncbi:MAG: hypothetical protein AB9869_08065 [Verrucomicrobiia bacterium]
MIQVSMGRLIFFSQYLVERADHHQVDQQKQEQPFDRELPHLAAVNQRAENPIQA